MSEKEPESKLDQIMAERREKGAALRAAGSHPYRNDIGPKDAIAKVRATYEPTRPPPPPPQPALAPGEKRVKAPPAPPVPIDGAVLRVAGRVTGKRGFG